MTAEIELDSAQARASHTAVPISLSPSSMGTFTSCPLVVPVLLHRAAARAAVGARRARARSSTSRCSTSCGGPPAERTIETALADLARAAAELAADPEFAAARAHRRGVGRSSTPTPRCSSAATSRSRTRATITVLGVELRVTRRDRRRRRRSAASSTGSSSTPTASSSSPTTRPARAPSEGWEQKSMAGVHIYSLLCERMFGRRPARVQLLYLSKPGAHHHRAERPVAARRRGEVERGDEGGAHRVHARRLPAPRRRRCARSARSRSSAPSSAATRARRRPCCSRARPNAKAGRSCRSSIV